MEAAHPDITALCKGVRPRGSLELGSAPYPRSFSTALDCLFQAAICKGVPPPAAQGALVVLLM